MLSLGSNAKHHLRISIFCFGLLKAPWLTFVLTTACNLCFSFCSLIFESMHSAINGIRCAWKITVAIVLRTKMKFMLMLSKSGRCEFGANACCAQTTWTYWEFKLHSNSECWNNKWTKWRWASHITVYWKRLQANIDTTRTYEWLKMQKPHFPLFKLKPKEFDSIVIFCRLRFNYRPNYNLFY